MDATFELLPQFRACDEPAALRALVRKLPDENRACSLRSEMAGASQ